MVADAESDGLSLAMDLLFVNAEGYLVRAHFVTVDEGADYAPENRFGSIQVEHEEPLMEEEIKHPTISTEE